MMFRRNTVNFRENADETLKTDNNWQPSVSCSIFFLVFDYPVIGATIIHFIFFFCKGTRKRVTTDLQRSNTQNIYLIHTFRAKIVL